RLSIRAPRWKRAALRPCSPLASSVARCTTSSARRFTWVDTSDSSAAGFLGLGSATALPWRGSAGFLGAGFLAVALAAPFLAAARAAGFLSLGFVVPVLSAMLAP